MDTRTNSAFIWYQKRRENVTNKKWVEISLSVMAIWFCFIFVFSGCFILFYSVLFECMVLLMLLDSEISIGDCFNATEDVHSYCKKFNEFS